MILTTPAHGLLRGPDHPFHNLALATQNALRLDAWNKRKRYYDSEIEKAAGLQTRDADTGSPQRRHGHYAPAAAGAAFTETLGLVSLIAAVAALLLGAGLLAAAIPAVGSELETRTFERPIDGTTYERTQRVWEVE
ncbi:MAG: hypothetical protein ACOC8P_00390 [Dichotomicrobium sp.]